MGSVLRAGSGIEIASVTLTAAQTLTIFTTPVTLIPAQGAGQQIVPINLLYNYAFGGTPYIDHGGTLSPYFGAVRFGAAAITTAGFWDTGASRVSFEAFTSGSADTTTAIATNAALMLKQDTANPTGGNGTLTVTVAYYVVPVA